MPDPGSSASDQYVRYSGATARSVPDPELSLPARRDLTLDGSPLGLEWLEHAAGRVDVSVDPGVLERVSKCRAFLEHCLADGRAVYGATTGFGPLVTYAGRSDSASQCENTLAHLGAGQGPDLDPGVVRAAVLVRLWSLAWGRSGVSPALVEALADCLGTGFAPAVPRLGSLGASGDLIPLAYVARALTGDGHAYLDGVRLPAGQALRHAGLRPLELDGRDALALVNGTSVTVAAAGLAVRQLVRSHVTALRLSALLADVLGCGAAHFDPDLLEAFGHPDAARAGAVLRELLAGTVTSGTRPLQEPYSIRCVPQLVGAAGSAIGYAEQVIRDDLRGISDNPVLFAERGAVAHGGNFFGQPVAFAADLMSIVATQLGNLAERQLDLLIDPHRNGGLPPMLAPEPGRQHAIQGVQLAATAILATMRRSAAPASIQSLPTNWHNQDVVPFGTQAALNALDQARLLRLLHGSLAVALRQAAHVSDHEPAASASRRLLDRLCARIPPVYPDRPLDREVRLAADLLDESGHEQ